VSNNIEFSVAEIYSVTLSEFCKAVRPPWEIVEWADGCASWRLFRQQNVSLPPQGWKIHISSAANEAPLLVSIVGPILIELGAAFKIANTLEDVVHINSGDAGAPQVGKIATVYPDSDAHASRIAVEVDRVWSRSCGPEVQTDLHVRWGSPVSFRYGAYTSGPFTISSSGVYEFALKMPDGTLIPDSRRLGGAQPPLGPAPPLAAYYSPRPLPIRLHESFSVEHRQYVPLVILKDSPRTKIFLGFSADLLNTVVLKVGCPGVAGDERGIDIRDRLRKEFEILSVLAKDVGLAPKPIDWINGEWPISIMEDFRGDFLSELSLPERVDALLPFANAVVRLHRAGFVHGDLKLENAVRREKQVGLIDFELSQRSGEIFGRGGTAGYVGPEVRPGAAAEFSRDVFALGICVAQAVLGISPSLLPEGVGRLRGLLALQGARTASTLVARFAHPDPSRRPTACEVAHAIADDIEKLKRIAPEPSVSSTVSDLRWCRRASISAASRIDLYAEHDESGMCWRNQHFMRAFRCEGLNLGASGILLGLISIDQAFGRSDFSSQVDLGARWLASRRAESSAPGLFTGNAGTAIALAVAGHRLGKEEYVRAAREHLRHAASDDRQIDLFSGSAGVLWACCLLRTALCQDWPLTWGHLALQTLKRPRRPGDGIPAWSNSSAKETHYLGCAHGSAGIALALACWGQQIGDQPAIEVALHTFRQLFAEGRTADGAALRTTFGANRSHAVGTWCHGVAGYLWCILQAFGDHRDLREEINWAVAILGNSMAVGTPTYCHGLAGQLEIWRMISAIPRYKELALARAGKTVRALRLMHSKVTQEITWRSDDPAVITPDLWIGFLAPATSIAMHVAGCKSALLSGQWLADCANGRRT
jgi:hypothetical protein